MRIIGASEMDQDNNNRGVETMEVGCLEKLKIVVFFTYL